MQNVVYMKKKVDVYKKKKKKKKKKGGNIGSCPQVPVTQVLEFINTFNTEMKGCVLLANCFPVF